MCVSIINLVAIGQTVAEIWPFFDFLRCGRPPSWICFTHVWATQEAHMVVFIAVQNLIGISVVILKICDFQYFCSLGLKIPIHNPFRVFWVKMEENGIFCGLIHVL